MPLLNRQIPIDTLAGPAAAEASEKATDNFAEYVAFNNALKEAKRRGWKDDAVTVFTDSELLHGQIGVRLEGQVAKPAWCAHKSRGTEVKVSFNQDREDLSREKQGCA